MSDWICMKCNQAMEECEDIMVRYGDMDLPPATGYRCPGCGVEYLSSEYVVNELSSAEQMLDGK